MRALIAGPNFSGRSATLRDLTRDPTFAREAFFIGPYAESALSGLTGSVADEITLYRRTDKKSPRLFAPLDFSALAARRPQTLSGGEQVLLALHCFSLSDYAAIAIDTALEQLDGVNRKQALDFLDARRGHAEKVALIDNRLPPPLMGWTTTELMSKPHEFAGDLAHLADDAPERAAPAIAIKGLSFAYRDRPVFRDVGLTLDGGVAYRLAGPNGAGKSTLLKLLVGALEPSAGEITLGGARYRPWRHGNRAIALATQNPDHQWCGATLGEDLARRRCALGRKADWPGVRLATLAERLGFKSGDQHLYELPLAARKRLSWLWPLSGVMPWLMLDEPTVGQDLAARQHLATAIATLCQRGYGIMFVTHDDAFAAMIPHRRLMVGGLGITVVSGS